MHVERFAVSEIDDKLAESEKQIAEIQRQANALRAAAQSRPTAVNDEDVALLDRLLAAWQTHRLSLVNHPEFRERARDLALKRATGRASAGQE